MVPLQLNSIFLFTIQIVPFQVLLPFFDLNYSPFIDVTFSYHMAIMIFDLGSTVHST
jgi:hypothetical protein